MSIAELSIRRPTLITCLVIVMLAVGFWSMNRLGVDIFPKINFPVVTVSTPYPGAGPNEIENLVSKPLEDELSTISGLKRLNSINKEGISIVVAEFRFETDVKGAEQQVRDRVAAAKRNLPSDILEPVVRRLDPGEQPVMILSLEANLSDQELFDLADDKVRSKIEQVNQVGLVEVIGGRKREIHIELDRAKLKNHEISASQVAHRLASAGENVPVGKVSEGGKETTFRSLGQFNSIDDIKKTIVNFFGSDIPVTVADVGSVTDSLKDESSRAFVNGKKSLFIYVFRQSGANTINVVSDVKEKLKVVNATLHNAKGAPEVRVIRDGSVWIHDNIVDVQESIFVGIILTILVVYFFLANGRSTIITGLALPNSLIGAFILMAFFGFTINLMTLLALSLAVGLLIDDAIVVRENIFRHIELGKDPVTAAKVGTQEVQLAVIATTLTVLAVFGPVAFLEGMVGQFFKEFGLTICFAMLISLFDALTIAPMLSAYFAGKSDTHETGPVWWEKSVGKWVKQFGEFQNYLEREYERILKYTMQNTRKVLAYSTAIFVFCCATIYFVPKTFLPPQDAGEFIMNFDLPPGSSLDETTRIGTEIDQALRKNPEVEIAALTVGDRDGQANVGEFYVKLVPSGKRDLNTSEVKEKIREQLKAYSQYNPAVTDFDAISGGVRTFNLNIIGDDQKELEVYAAKALDLVKKHPGLKDVDINYRSGKPELQIPIQKNQADNLGVSTVQVGMELRTLIEGATPAKFREAGQEYDVRVRLQADQRDLKAGFTQTYVPNINYNLVRLSDVATAVETQGPAKIHRQDRSRFIQISADTAPNAGLGDIIADISKSIDKDMPLPPTLRYQFVGQAESIEELSSSMKTAIIFGVLFIFLILASLYESFITPLTIMLALPLGMCGSILALAITGESMNIFSMIGMIMLLGVATKNSILLVDYANQLVLDGHDRTLAIIQAGKARLRPILMTTMALIAGTIPVAVGLNEASKQRSSMGVAIIGGLISSTLLTLVVIPAAYAYIDRFRVWSKAKVIELVGPRTFTPQDVRPARSAASNLINPLYRVNWQNMKTYTKSKLGKQNKPAEDTATEETPAAKPKDLNRPEV